MTPDPDLSLYPDLSRRVIFGSVCDPTAQIRDDPILSVVKIGVRRYATACTSLRDGTEVWKRAARIS